MTTTTLRLLDTGPLTAADNMALDRIILEEVAAEASPPTMRYLQFSPPAALVGYNQDVDLELRTDYCAEHGIDINRRLTGGGAILFQESALGWEFFGRAGQSPFRGSFDTILSRICTIAADALGRFEIEAQFRPRNDIEVNGRKISGTGGTTVSGAFMFQGTLLIENEIELFLKALRVPVEKLKKREIESLLDRICFLRDIVESPVETDLIKHEMAEEFAQQLGIQFQTSGLTEHELRRLEAERSYYSGDEWIRAKSRPPAEGVPARSIMQTGGGTMRVHLWSGPGGRRIRQALVVGDFFSAPARLAHDLEAALVGCRLEKSALSTAVHDFLREYDGSVLGVKTQEIARAFWDAAERTELVNGAFTLAEANELFFVNTNPTNVMMHRPRWLLLPYCAKRLDCDYRFVSGCDECGACDIGDCCGMARAFDMEPITIQSFEHLMEVLKTECEGKDGLYVGSCCEAFYSKHQKEMEAVNARGILVNLDSTTCYDLGKGTPAYKGNFDNQTTMSIDLIRKTIAFLHDSS